MKTIIAGSRNFHYYDFLEQVIGRSGFKITEVVHGCAAGADALGKCWAVEKSIDVKDFPANWQEYGKAAGPVRNAEMADYADQAIVIRLNNSKGSSSMINEMIKRKKPVYVVDIMIKEELK